MSPPHRSPDAPLAGQDLPPGVAAAAGDVLAATLAGPATLGPGRLVCVDGPAGSGKTTLAEAVAALAPARLDRRVVHMDDLYPGWSGLAEGVAAAARDLVGPLARGTTGGYRRYDWVRGRPAEWVEVPPPDLLVLEGVGAGSASYAEAIGVLVWVEADPETRLARGLRRDGEAMREHWLRWMAAEEALFARERTRERARFRVRTDP